MVQKGATKPLTLSCFRRDHVVALFFNKKKHPTPRRSRAGRDRYMTLVITWMRMNAAMKRETMKVM